MNINYLNHSFVLDYEGETFKGIYCEVCKKTGWYFSEDNTYYIDYPASTGYEKLVLSCEEMQIKNLLE